MVRRIVVAVLAVMFVSTTLSAQRVEVSFSAGYTASEGISVEDRAFLGQIYNKAEVNSGASFNFTGGVYVTPSTLIEFLYGRQSSKLTAEGTTKLDVSEMSVDSYHVNFVYHWGDSDAKVRPFFFGGLGATNYSFGDILVSGATGNIPGDTKFSTNWGAGVKFYPAPKIGIKAQARWIPTYVKSGSAGVWCDPFYGCWVLPDPDYSNQFEMSGGITFRF
jgi:Outer membrane protein beta-barrel domain